MSLILFSSFSFSSEICIEKISCAKIGIKYEKAGDMVNSDKAFIESCNLGLGLSCAMIGVRYEKRNDLNKAIEFYSNGCSLNNSISCKYLALIQLKNRNQDAIKNLEKACELNDFSSCEQLGVLYLKGDIIKSNFKKSYLFFNKACNDGSKEKSCKAVSIMTKALENSKK